MCLFLARLSKHLRSLVPLSEIDKVNKFYRVVGSDLWPIAPISRRDSAVTYKRRRASVFTDEKNANAK